VLNNIIVPSIVPGQLLVSHCVCRYDCPASVRYAEALLQEVARVNADAAEESRRALGGLVVLFRRGGALRLVPSALAAGGVYRFATVDASGSGPRFEQWRTALCSADGLEVLDGSVRLLRGTEETCRLSAPASEVQVRLFA
jgi:hypothetical protein